MASKTGKSGGAKPGMGSPVNNTPPFKKTGGGGKPNP